MPINLLTQALHDHQSGVTPQMGAAGPSILCCMDAAYADQPLQALPLKNENDAGSSVAQAEQKADGCICAESGSLCGCTMNGLHSGEAGEGPHPATWSPFADMDQGPGLHGSVCSCQRCKLEDGGNLDGSPGRPTLKGVQTSATPGPALVLHSDADRREFISAGAAGGLAVRLWPLIDVCAFLLLEIRVAPAVAKCTGREWQEFV